MCEDEQVLQENQYIMKELVYIIQSIRFYPAGNQTVLESLKEME